MRQRILFLGRHPVLPRLVSHYVEQRAEVLFKRDDKPIDLCIVCQYADVDEVGALVSAIPKDLPAILVTDAAVYSGAGEAPNKSKRGMSELVEQPYENREDQLAQMWLEHHFQRSTEPRIVVRLFDVYGPGVLAGVIPHYIQKALKQEDIHLDFVDRQRTFLYIDDFLAAFLALEKRIREIKFDVFNVGATEVISYSRLAHYVWTMTHGQDSVPQLVAWDGDSWPVFTDQMWKLPNIRRIQGFTGWNPKVSLRQGLFHTIDYLSKR